MKKPMLSICVPTYNRAMTLDRLLRCMHALPDGVGDGIEICVSDNCSKDNTRQIAKKWASKLPLKYGRNSDNLGYDRNVLASLSMANGDFAWLMSDDDLPMPGSLATMLEAVRKADKTRVGALYAVPFPNRNKRIATFKSAQTFSKSDKDCPPINITFIGSICLNLKVAREIIREKIRNSERGIEKLGRYPRILDGCVHSYLFLECVSRTGFFVLIPKPCIKSTGRSELKVSHEQRFYVYTILRIFPIEMWKAYPWFSYDTTSTAAEDLKDYFLLATLSLMRPHLGELYRLDAELYRRYFRRSNKRLLLVLVKLVDIVRSIPILNQSLVLLLIAGRAMLRNNMTDDKEDGPSRRKWLADVAARARLALADDGG